MTLRRNVSNCYPPPAITRWRWTHGRKAIKEVSSTGFTYGIIHVLSQHPNFLQFELLYGNWQFELLSTISLSMILDTLSGFNHYSLLLPRKARPGERRGGICSSSSTTGLVAGLTEFRVFLCLGEGAKSLLYRAKSLLYH